MNRTEQLREAKRLSAVQMKNIEKAIRSQDQELADLAKQALADIRKARWSVPKANEIIDRLFADRQDIMARTIADGLRDSAELNDRVMKIYDEYQPTAPIVTKAEIALARQYGAAVIKGTQVKVPDLSEVLHHDTAVLKEATKKSIARSIREMRNADLAGKDLIQTVQRLSGTEVADVQIPQKLDRYIEALKNLRGSDKLPGKGQWPRLDEARKARVQLEKYVAKLRDGRVGYGEFRQIIEKQGTDGLEHAVERWISEKQRYHAERITRTEMAAQHRQRQLDQWKRESRVIGVMWHLSGGRKAYVKRTPAAKSGPHKGTRCRCEEMAGTIMTLEEAENHIRGWHPHCKCFHTPVYGKVYKLKKRSE